eukprot:2353304-Rhodomonas_salina.2
MLVCGEAGYLEAEQRPNQDLFQVARSLTEHSLILIKGFFIEVLVALEDVLQSFQLPLGFLPSLSHLSVSQATLLIRLQSFIRLHHTERQLKTINFLLTFITYIHDINSSPL